MQCSTAHTKYHSRFRSFDPSTLLLYCTCRDSFIHRTSIIDHRTSIIEHRSSNIEHRSSIIDHRLVVGGWRWFVDQSYQNCTVQCTSLHFINFTSSLSLTVVHSSLTHSAHSLSVTVSEASVAQHSFYCLFPPSFHSSVYLNLHSLIPTYFQNLFTYCTCIFFHTLAETVSGRKRVSQ